LEKDISVSKLLGKGVAASEQMQQAERRNEKQPFHNGYLSTCRQTSS
jgi:hypothetical protein